MFNLLLLYEPPPTNRVRLARLLRLPADTGRVRAGFGAEKEPERPADEQVFALLDIRGGCPLAIVEALLVSEGTSSIELCKVRA